jgi:ribosomal protein L11 methyltransferase
LIRLNPGAGFGTGTHETTQLALGAIGMLKDLSGKTVLDFGSGSGILSLAAAVLGAQVDGVEIDPLAVDNARENLKLNLDLFANRVRFELELHEPSKKYDVIIANILRPVLVANAKKLVERLKPKGCLILSGIIETDLPHIFKAYDRLIPQAKQSLYELKEWRAVVIQLS